MGRNTNNLYDVLLRMEVLREIHYKYANLRSRVIGHSIPEAVCKYDEKGELVDISLRYSDTVDKLLKELSRQEEHEIDMLDKRPSVWFYDNF